MVYRVQDAARLLEVYPKDIRKWIESGKLSCDVSRIEQGRPVYAISDDDLISFFIAYPDYFPLAEIFVRKCDIFK